MTLQTVANHVNIIKQLTDDIDIWEAILDLSKDMGWDDSVTDFFYDRYLSDQNYYSSEDIYNELVDIDFVLEQNKKFTYL